MTMTTTRLINHTFKVTKKIGRAHTFFHVLLSTPNFAQLLNSTQANTWRHFLVDVVR